MDGLQRAAESFIMDPANHDLLLLVKAIRNGIVYGTKVRLPHAFVMVMLFRSGTLKQKVNWIWQATKQHAKNLATYAFLYKFALVAARRLFPDRKEQPYDVFLSGIGAGYWVWGRAAVASSSVNQQITIYVFARAFLAFARLAVQPTSTVVASGPPGVKATGYGPLAKNGPGYLDAVLGSSESANQVRKYVADNAWVTFACTGWAMMMYMYRWHPELVQPSMASSMLYIYDNADRWDGLRNFIWHNK